MDETKINLNEEPNEETEVKETVVLEPKKPSLLGKVWRGITAPARWWGRKVKENPAAAAVNMVLGGALTLAAKEGIKYVMGHKGPGFVPAETKEIEIDPIPTTFNDD